MFKTPSIEACSIFSGKSKTGAFLKTFLASAKQSAPQYFHNCPYIGVHSGSNMTILNKFLKFFPNGKFKLKVSVSDGVSEIFKFLVDYSVY